MIDGHPWTFVVMVLFVVPALDAMIGRGAPAIGAGLEKSAERSGSLLVCAYMGLCSGDRRVPCVQHAPALHLIGLIVAMRSVERHRDGAPA